MLSSIFGTAKKDTSKDTPNNKLNTSPDIISDYVDLKEKPISNVISKDELYLPTDIIEGSVWTYYSLDDGEKTYICKNGKFVLEDSKPEFNQEYIDSLSLVDIKQKCIEITNPENKNIIKPADKFGYYPSNRYNTFTGVYSITFTDNFKWDGYIGELKDGYIHGFGRLYNSTCYSEGARIYQIDLYSRIHDYLVKGEYYTNNMLFRGTFLNNELSGPDCYMRLHDAKTHDIIAVFRGEFKNGNLVSEKGIYDIIPIDIRFENMNATLSKKEDAKYATITLENNVTITCDIKSLLGNKPSISKIYNIRFPDNCEIICFNDGTHLGGYSSIYSRDKPYYCLTSLVDYKFLHLNDFNDIDAKLVKQWDPFTFKCFLMITFPNFSSDFFNNFTKEVPNKKILCEMKERHYISLGLTPVQYLHMVTEMSDMFGVKLDDLDK